MNSGQTPKAPTRRNTGPRHSRRRARAVRGPRRNGPIARGRANPRVSRSWRAGARDGCDARADGAVAVCFRRGSWGERAGSWSTLRQAGLGRQGRTRGLPQEHLSPPHLAALRPLPAAACPSRARPPPSRNTARARPPPVDTGLRTAACRAISRETPANSGARSARAHTSGRSPNNSAAIWYRGMFGIRVKTSHKS